MLVELRVFRKSKLGFLLVGHTHDQIDQMLSRFSKKLNHMSTLILPIMVEIINGSYTLAPHIIFFNDTLDFKRLITDMYPSPTQELKDVSFKLQFRIKKEDGQMLMWARSFPTTKGSSFTISQGHPMLSYLVCFIEPCKKLKTWIDQQESSWMITRQLQDDISKKKGICFIQRRQNIGGGFYLKSMETRASCLRGNPIETNSNLSRSAKCRWEQLVHSK